MKTIYLKATVRNDMDLPLKFIVFEGDAIFYRCTKVTEITFPTEEEMNLEADKYYMAIPKGQPKKDCDIAFLRGANWLLNKIKEQ